MIQIFHLPISTYGSDTLSDETNSFIVGVTNSTKNPLVFYYQTYTDYQGIGFGGVGDSSTYSLPVGASTKFSVNITANSTVFYPTISCCSN